jgi:hypothetical protein
MVIYSVIARTNENEVPVQTRTTVGISLYVIPNNGCGVRTNQNKGQHKLLL